MSCNTAAYVSWSSLGRQLANIHLSLAVEDASNSDEVRATLRALRPAAGFDTIGPAEYHHAYEKRLNGLLGWYEYKQCFTICCTDPRDDNRPDDEASAAWAAEWLVSEDADPREVEPDLQADRATDTAATACEVCQSAPAYFDREVCATCFADKDLLRDYYDPDWRWDRLRHGE